VLSAIPHRYDANELVVVVVVVVEVSQIQSELKVQVVDILVL
jgi:hypothetical protein